MGFKLFDDNDPIQKLIGEDEIEKYLDASMETIGRLGEDIQRGREHRNRLRDDPEYKMVNDILSKDEYFKKGNERRDREYEKNLGMMKIIKDKLGKDAGEVGEDSP